MLIFAPNTPISPVDPIAKIGTIRYKPFPAKPRTAWDGDDDRLTASYGSILGRIENPDMAIRKRNR